MHSSLVVPHEWMDSPQTPNMTTASRQIVLTRAKARALGIPLSDLLGPDFTRLFHDTYVGSGQMITLLLAGLPEPQVNVIVRIAGGKWRWRFDLCYPEYKLIIEYDGCQHAYDAGQWSHDLERREWLDQDGWRLLVVISDGIYADPLRTLQRVRSALEERGARVPKSFKQEWTRHFMARS